MTAEKGPKRDPPPTVASVSTEISEIFLIWLVLRREKEVPHLFSEGSSFQEIYTLSHPKTCFEEKVKSATRRIHPMGWPKKQKKNSHTAKTKSGLIPMIFLVDPFSTALPIRGQKTVGIRLGKFQGWKS